VPAAAWFRASITVAVSAVFWLSCCIITPLTDLAAHASTEHHLPRHHVGVEQVGRTQPSHLQQQALAVHGRGASLCQSNG
jgi:hypothetical protein